MPSQEQQPQPEPSYASGAGGEPLLGGTIGAELARPAARHPKREALVDVAQERRWTWEEFERDVELLALGLLGKGVAKGERVGVWAPDCGDWALVQFAAARIGAVLVGIDPDCGPGTLRDVLQRTATEILFTTEARVGTVEEVWDACPALRDVHPLLGGWSEPMDLGLQIGDPRRTAEREAQLTCDDPATVHYPPDPADRTGPGGVTLSHHALLNNARAVGGLLGHTEHDRICVPVPLHDPFGMVLGTLAAAVRGACAVFPPPSRTPHAVLRTVQAERCTTLLGTPALFPAEPDAGYDLSSLRAVVVNGGAGQRIAPAPGGAATTVVYGTHGTAAACLLARADDADDAGGAGGAGGTDDTEDTGDTAGHGPGTAGSVLPHLEVKVADPVTGVPVPRGQPGRLCVRGYAVMLGYWEDPARTAAALDSARWLHTGDLAVMDAAGSVRIVGRADTGGDGPGHTADPVTAAAAGPPTEAPPAPATRAGGG